MRLSLKQIIFLGIFGLFIAANAAIISIVNDLTGLDVPTGWLCLCDVAFIFAILLILGAVLTLVNRRKAVKTEVKNMKYRYCASCNSRLNYRTDYGWYCEKCMRYEK